MHPDKTNTTLEDLWPGDIVIAPDVTYGNHFTTAAFRYVDSRKGYRHELIVTLRTLDGEREHEVVADQGWKTRVERVA